jgi:hypothetical protein
MLKTGLAMALALMLVTPAANAQLMNQLQNGLGQGGGSSSSGGGGGAGGLRGAAGGIPSVGSASTGNLAGVLQYCIKNKYLGGNGASSVKDSLLGKVNGGTGNSEYQSGSNGQLQTGNGENYSLGGGGIKQQVTNKVCDLVMQHAKSLL